MLRGFQNASAGQKEGQGTSRLARLMILLYCLITPLRVSPKRSGTEPASPTGPLSMLSGALRKACGPWNVALLSLQASSFLFSGPFCRPPSHNRCSLRTALLHPPTRPPRLPLCFFLDATSAKRLQHPGKGEIQAFRNVRRSCCSYGGPVAITVIVIMHAVL